MAPPHVTDQKCSKFPTSATVKRSKKARNKANILDKKIWRWCITKICARQHLEWRMCFKFKGQGIPRTCL